MHRSMDCRLQQREKRPRLDDEATDNMDSVVSSDTYVSYCLLFSIQYTAYG